MMRVVLLFVLCGALWAEVRMNIEQLRAFVTSSQKLGHSDKQIADYVKKHPHDVSAWMRRLSRTWERVRERRKLFGG